MKHLIEVGFFLLSALCIIPIIPLDAMEQFQLVKIICQDGESIDLELDVLKQSVTFANMLSDVINSGMQISVPINTESMKFIYQCMLWLHGKAAYKENFKKPMPSDIRSMILDLTKVVLCKLNNEHEYYRTQAGILELIDAASYLNIPYLYKALCCAVAKQLDLFFPLDCNISLLDKVFSLQPPSRYPQQVCSDIKQSIEEAHYFLRASLIENTDVEMVSWFRQIEWGMIDDASISGEIKNFNEYISHSVEQKKYEELQNTLNFLTKVYVPHAQKAFKALVTWIKKLPNNKSTIENIFTDPKLKESYFKMALRLAYALLHNTNLDKLKCVEFIKNKTLINNELSMFSSTDLFNQEYLPVVLPLIEPILGIIVTKLNLSCNDLIELPMEIGILSNLMILIVEYNELKKISGAVMKLAYLKQLSLHKNKLTKLPYKKFYSTSFEILDISENSFTKIPDVIFTLKRLKALDLTRNKITHVPKSITCCTSLSKLCVDADIGFPAIVASWICKHKIALCLWNPVMQTWMKD